MATIASLIVSIAADTSTIKRDVENVAGQMNKLEGIAGRVGTALAGAFTVSAIVGAGKKVIDYASHISDLSDRLRISTTTAQQWEAAFGKSGISLETVAKAAEQLSAKLVGDKGAGKLLEKLGFNLQTLTQMSPEARFNAVADAIGGIQNTAEQLYASKTLLGKGGAEVLGALDGHLQQTINQLTAMGVVIDEKTIRSADAFGDQLDVLEKVGLSLIAQVLVPILPGLMAVAQWFAKVAAGSIAFAHSLEDWLIKKLLQARAAFMDFLVTIAEGSQKVPLLGKYIGASAGTLDGLRESAHQAHDQVRLFSTTVDIAAEASHKATPKLLGLGGAADGAAKATEEAGRKIAAEYARQNANSVAWADAVEKIEADMYHERLTLENKFFSEQERIALQAGERILQDTIDLNKSIIGLDAERLRNLLIANGPGVVGGTGQQLNQGHESGVKWAEGFQSALGSIGPAIMGALQGGGNVLKSAGSAFGGQLTQHIFGKDSGMAGKIAGAFGPALGGAFNALLPGIGVLIGPLLGKIAGAFANVFGGPDAKEKAGRSLTDQFTDSLKSSLDWQQQIELHQLVAAGNSEKWSTQIIALNAAYQKAGHTVDEVAIDVNRLQAAEKQGGNAVQIVLDEIITKMHDTVPVMDAVGDAGVDAFGSIADAAHRTGMTAIEAASNAYNAWARTYAYMNAGGSNVNPENQALSPENYSSFGDWMSAYLNFNQGATHDQIAAAWRSNSVTPSWADEAIAAGYAHGGFVRGMGGIDSVLARLTPGELVLNAAQQRNVAGALSGGGGGTTIVNVNGVNVGAFSGKSDREVALIVGMEITQQMKRNGVQFPRA